MNTHLDILGSFIIAGLFLLGFARFNGERQAALLEATNNAMNQNAMSSVVTLMMSDIRKCGYGVNGEAFVTIQPRRLKFRADLDNNGTVDSVQYWFADAATGTPNPSDSLLYRQVNDEDPQSASLGIVDLRFRYYTATGTETSTLNQVAAVGVTARIQSLVPVDGVYQESRSAFRISPRNNK